MQGHDYMVETQLSLLAHYKESQDEWIEYKWRTQVTQQLCEDA
jgi:hypothetical protein